MTITCIHPADARELPIKSSSSPVLLEPYNVDLLPEYNYTSREYLLEGVAAGKPYCTRLLLRSPSDLSKFSGDVIIETSHLWGGTSVWRALSKWLMASGHAWMEVDAQAPSAMGLVKAANPERYAGMHFPPGPLSKDFVETLPFVADPNRQELEDAYSAFMVRWWAATPQTGEILAQASHFLRADSPLHARRVYLSGISQTGGVSRRFVTHSSHLRLPTGAMPFEGIMPCASGGAALPDPPAGVKVIEVLGEAEFQSVRWACGVSGQARGVSHRRPDSDSFRLYEIAGMAHRETRYMSDLDCKKLAPCPLVPGAKWSKFPNAFVYAAIWEHMMEWTREGGSAPPASKTLSTIGDTDEIVRDQHGNAIGGVRNVFTDVPVSQVIAATPMGRPSWYQGTEIAFGVDKLRELYKTPEAYRSAAKLNVLQNVKDGFLRAKDVEVLEKESIDAVDF
ncbi:hypothetical protein T439DRAFT_327533 [Meredithblackwellia eburnea MCA 4105]